jgi:ribonuclease III
LANIIALQSTLGITFKYEALLKQALTHTSYINENPESTIKDNQRMEFLGDSLLNFIVAEKLYNDLPDLPEGNLTEIRVSLVRQEKLAEKAMALNLGEYMILGKGEGLSGGRNKRNNLADTFEALIAAIFLDQGADAARSFVLKHLKNDIQAVKAGKVQPNYKALLQELTQAEFKLLPEYKVVNSTGPDHDRSFSVSVSLGSVALAAGSGKSKKLAEIEAARVAFTRLSKKS